jgi:glycerate 2-kinase
MKVLIVPDKFKGTLRAQDAAAAIAAGWREVRPQDDLELLPMSDGGDGFGEVIGGLLRAEAKYSKTINAAHEPIQARWWWSEPRQTVILESAGVIGLAMLPRGKFHPFNLDTFGLGETIKEISDCAPRVRLIVGIGGSATNDAGFGLARSLGYQFQNRKGEQIASWIELDQLEQICRPQIPSQFSEVLIATDVRNPLLGPEGATRVYGPQKGLVDADFETADRCFMRLAGVVQNDLGFRVADEPGAGAAGGLGYGLRVFLGGRFESGFEVFAEVSNLKHRMQGADLVITAEGGIDAQTAMGKGTGAIAKLARESGKECIGLAGSLSASPQGLFTSVSGIYPDLTTIEEAMQRPAFWLQKLASDTAQSLS